MTISITTQASEMPETLPDSDFGFAIDYNKNEGSAKRVFGATYRFIEACEACSLSLVGSLGLSIDPVIVLEDVEVGSIKTWFKAKWEEDGLYEATKSGDYKQVIGTLLASGIQQMVDKINDPESPPKLSDIQSDLYELSKDANLESLTTREPISGEDLIEIVKKFESVKESLIPGDKAEFLLSEEARVLFVQSFKVSIEKLEEEATRETSSHRDQAMILVVKKPDYLGTSQWLFRYGGKNLAATIEDEEWLNRFQARKIDVRPGDALKCEVRIEVAYGYSNNVIAQKHYIEKVQRVIEKGNGGAQLPQMF